MAIHTLTIDVDIPEGYEPVIKDGKAEWRWPEPDEPFLACTGRAISCHDNDQCGRRMTRLILRKSWRPPADADLLNQICDILRTARKV